MALDELDVSLFEEVTKCQDLWRIVGIAQASSRGSQTRGDTVKRPFILENAKSPGQNQTMPFGILTRRRDEQLNLRKNKSTEGRL
jgi:hypothetical protein